MSEHKLQLNWDVIGHEPILHFLEKNLDNQSFAHAYLFVGPGKIGKTTVAKKFGNFVVCEQFQRLSLNDTGVKLKNLGCGECNTCRMYSKGLYADFHLLEREENDSGTLKQNISVKQIRELHTHLNKRSFQNSYKVVLIPEAETLSDGASNSLLKFLEEPTQQTMLILVAPDKNMVLPTILSRCQVLQYSPVSRETIYQQLLNKDISKNEAWDMAALSAGRPTVAMQFAEDRDFYFEYKEKARGVLQLLSGGLADRLLNLEKMLGRTDQKRKALEILNILTSIYRDLQLLKVYQDDLVQHVFLHDELKSVGRENHAWHKKIKQVQEGINYVEHNVTPRLVLETILIS